MTGAVLSRKYVAANQKYIKIQKTVKKRRTGVVIWLKNADFHGFYVSEKRER